MPARGPSDDLRDAWAQVEARLRAVLAAVDLTDADRRQVEEFLDHNGLGLAFQEMVGALADAKGRLGREAHHHLAVAAAAMDLDDDPDWRRLDGLAAGRRGIPPPT